MPARSEGEMFTASLSEDPPCQYCALSYVWGDATKTSDIWVNDKRVGITRNLDRALRDLRPQQDTLVIWIDALCNNQSDSAEVSHQVQMMGRIYSTATTVRSWLDMDVDVSSACFKHLEAHGSDIDWTRFDAEFWLPVVLVF